MSWKTKRVGAAECVMAFPEVPTKLRPKFDTRSFRTYTPNKTQITQLGVTFDPRTPYSDECLIRVRVEYYSERYEKEK